MREENFLETNGQDSQISEVVRRGKLRKAGEKDAAKIYNMQRRAFVSFARHDEDNAVSHTKITEKLLEKQIHGKNGAYWLFSWDGAEIGAARIVKEGKDNAKILSLFLLPEFQGKGLALYFLFLLEKCYQEEASWHIPVFGEEKGLCRFLERGGFVKAGSHEAVGSELPAVNFKKYVLNAGRFAPADGEEISALVKACYLASQGRIFRGKPQKERLKHFGRKSICDIAQRTKAYVFRNVNHAVVGFGILWVGNSGGSESVRLVPLIEPTYRERGIIRKVLLTLEKDPVFAGARRKEIVSGEAIWDVLGELSLLTGETGHARITEKEAEQKEQYGA